MMRPDRPTPALVVAYALALTMAAAAAACVETGGRSAGEGPGPVGGKGDEVAEGEGEGEYGFATQPPRRVLADTFYTYDLRTNIGDCATDRVEWTLTEGPDSATLVLPSERTLQIGEAYRIEGGGDARESVKLVWDLAGVGAQRVDVGVRWRAWRDCGLTDDGAWGPTVEQRWSIEVVTNNWYSGDLHVHTKHSERGEEAGSAWDYYERMVGEAPDDAGHDFSDRRLRSLRGQLHWLVFSDHTNNQHEECGRHFPLDCGSGDLVENTGRDVVRRITEQDDSVLLVVGSEISNKFDGHFGFIPANPFPGHARYAPGYTDHATDYEFDAGFGAGVFRERWVDEGATNQEQIDLAHRMNGLVIVNHEAGPAPWVTYDWSSMDFDGLEVWNGGVRHDRFDDDAYHGRIDVNEVADDDELTAEIEEDDLEQSWLGMIKQGRWPMVAVGGSDVHDATEVVCFDGPCALTRQELALPTTSVWAEEFVWTNGETGIYDALAAGRTVIHDFSNFIDFRVEYRGEEFMIGDTIEGYRPGEPLTLRAFGRVANFVDGDNRVLLMMGTAVDPEDREVDVLYNSEDEEHFVAELRGKDHMRYLRPDANFDREWTVELRGNDFGPDGTYVMWSQFIPWHNLGYGDGNGQDMAETGAIRIAL